MRPPRLLTSSCSLTTTSFLAETTSGRPRRPLQDNADVVMTTGQVVEDGIRGPGLGFDEAAETLAKCEDEPSLADEISETGSGYGCNMACASRNDSQKQDSL